jgi:prepilin-type processing-associated H-X9-DG protein
MHPDLIAYASGSLDEPARARFECQLRDDADLRRQFELVRRRLAPLRADAAHDAPPPGLLLTTLAFVAEHACRDAPSAPIETTVSRPTFERPWWRRIDAIVAASIAVTVVGLALPGLLHLRVLSLQTQCENNLRQLWTGLSAYQTQRHELPDVATSPRPAAGMVIPMLRDAGVLSSHQVTSCPGGADGALCLNVGLRELANMPGRDFELAAPRLLPNYAYSLGFKDEDGRLRGPAASLPDVPAAQIPLLADAPATPVAFGNSANHSGRGQNVLFTDGHVAFKTTRAAGLPGDDIYLNQKNKVARGLGSHDVVLATGAAAP